VRLPIRVRITAAFALVLAVLLAVLSLAIYWSISSALLDEIDSGLRYRAAAIASTSRTGAVETPNVSLEEPGEAFDQLLTADGKVLRSTPGIPATPLLTRNELSSVTGPAFFQRQVAGVAGTARLLVLPLAGSSPALYLVVGTTMSDRQDALRQLLVVNAIGLPVAIGLACLAGWVVAGLALRPVEEMRSQASAITGSGLDHRLALPRVQDELYRLGQTLNDMLERLDNAQRRDRVFLARASHDLRTPLASLKAELDLARSRPRSKEELAAALASASEEADRLTRLSNDLLVEARTQHGRLPVRRSPSPLPSLVESALDSFRLQIGSRHISVTSESEDRAVDVDPIRFRQAVDNILDNAIRHTPPGGSLLVLSKVLNGTLTIRVRDSGPGFVDPLAQQARLDDVDNVREDPAQGLGLRTAWTIASSHGGTLRLSNPDTGGAEVALTFRDVDLA
jgi:signal transduction histidine kinase